MNECLWNTLKWNWEQGFKENQGFVQKDFKPFHQLNLFKLSCPVKWLENCMESVNFFRPCLPASSAVPIRIRPMWRSVPPLQRIFDLLQIISYVCHVHKPSIIYCKDLPFWVKLSSRCGRFATLPGETCQCWAENYQGLDRFCLVYLHRNSPEFPVRTWRKTNASRSTIRRKWTCPRQLIDLLIWCRWIKNRTWRIKNTSCFEIHGNPW